MKRQLLALLVLCLSCAFASAEQFGDFHGQVTSGNLKPFALDLGGVLGAAGAPSGKTIGFPGGSVGVTGAVQFHPDKNDTIIRQTGNSSFGGPLVEAAVGLPKGVDIVGHGIKVGKTSLYGGGVRYGLIQAGTFSPEFPSLDVALFYDGLNQVDFSGQHFGASLGGTWTLIPIVHPFANIGYDSTQVKIKQAAAANLVGMKATANGYRMAFGVELVPLPLVKLRLAYALLHNLPGATAALLLQF
jgi:hypothetical protein